MRKNLARREVTMQRFIHGRLENSMLACRNGEVIVASVRFITETSTGVPYLIEMNPRRTQLGHLEFTDQCSLAGVFSTALRGEPRPLSDNPDSARYGCFISAGTHGDRN
jgi:hypothetical protein